MRERQRGERGDVRRDHEPENYAQPAPGSTHTESIRPFPARPLTVPEGPVIQRNTPVTAGASAALFGIEAQQLGAPLDAAFEIGQQSLVREIERV